jgi:hypothetical protein
VAGLAFHCLERGMPQNDSLVVALYRFLCFCADLSQMLVMALGARELGDLPCPRLNIKQASEIALNRNPLDLFKELLRIKSMIRSLRRIMDPVHY